MEPLGAPQGRKRWRSRETGRLFEWDPLHGEIEVYNRLGWHLGVLDPSGKFKKGAVKGRKIDV